MEENTFLDFNPQFNTKNDPMQNNYTNSVARSSDVSVWDRWLNPGIAEEDNFYRENYFVDKENAFNEYMFNKANEWNSESARMERMKAAGINPNLAAQGISGTPAQAMPMQGASGQTGMNTAVSNPIEDISKIVGMASNAVEGAEGLGRLFGFGKKNSVEIKQIQELTNKYAEEWKLTRRERRQLNEIGEILVDNARREGKNLEQQLENLRKQYEVFDQQKWNIAADTNLKTEQTGTEVQNRKSIWYDNQKKEFEKTFREMFGAETTHDKISFMAELMLNGKGNKVIEMLSDGLAKILTEIGKQTRNAINSFKLPKLPTRKPNTIDRDGKTINKNEAKKIGKRIRYHEREWIKYGEHYMNNELYENKLDFMRKKLKQDGYDIDDYREYLYQ